MAKRSRDKMITFWVTEDELAKINANMEKLGTSNQMAKHINQGDPIAVQQIGGLHEQQEEIWSGVRGVLQQLSTLQFE